MGGGQREISGVNQEIIRSIVIIKSPGSQKHGPEIFCRRANISKCHLGNRMIVGYGGTS